MKADLADLLHVHRYAVEFGGQQRPGFQLSDRQLGPNHDYNRHFRRGLPADPLEANPYADDVGPAEKIGFMSLLDLPRPFDPLV